VQHAEESVPWSDGIAVLVSENAGDLMEVGHVVRGPGGEQLREGDSAKRRMTPATVQIVRQKIEGTQGIQVFRPQTREFIE
jgi:hypothetical protein